MFLEASAGKQPKYDRAADDAAIKIIETKCKNAIPMILANKMIYRGDSKAPAQQTLNVTTKIGAWVVDTSATERKSQNTSNHYTVIFDNHPGYKSFPKRSRSFICSTNLATAQDYSASDAAVLVVIPFDKTRIGICPKADMWDKDIKVFGETMAIESLNYRFRMMGIKDNFNAIMQFSNELAKKDPKAVKKFEKAFDVADSKSMDNFLGEIFEALSPKKIGMTSATTATLGIGEYKNREVWVGGNVLLIAMNRWDEFRKYFLENYEMTE
jgi:hypothetical protein